MLPQQERKEKPKTWCIPPSTLPRCSLFEKVIIIEKNPDVIENFVEFAGRGMHNEVGRDPHLYKHDANIC